MYILNCEMKVYNYVTQVLKQGINIKTMCPSYTTLDTRSLIIASISRCVGQDRNCHRIPGLLCYRSLSKMSKRYPSTYQLIQGSCAISSNVEPLKV